VEVATRDSGRRKGNAEKMSCFVAKIVWGRQMD
jgi:hypothetical protein